MAQFRWYDWSGAAGGAAAAGYADARLRRYTSGYQNSQLVEAGVIALDVMGVGDRGPFWTSAIDGAADWAVGALAAGMVSRRFMAPAAPPAPTPTAAAQPPAAAPGANPYVGVPASGGSAAFLPASPGY